MSVKFFQWNTKNIDINGVIKQNTHTHIKHWEKDNMEKGYYENKWYSLS